MLKKIIEKIKDPVSALTHLSFAMLAPPLTAVMICLACFYGTVWHVVSLAIFGLALCLLYTASAVYHMIPNSGKIGRRLHKLDHMMIFVLIAGTYTPICLLPLRGVWGIVLLVLIWLFALAGILMKLFWMGAPRALSAGIYVAMGWLVVIAFYPLVNSMPARGLWYLALGGVTYTIGAVIYAIKRPRLKFKWFGFHEVFHVFVMCGSVFHILLMFFMIFRI